MLVSFSGVQVELPCDFSPVYGENEVLFKANESDATVLLEVFLDESGETIGLYKKSQSPTPNQMVQVRRIERQAPPCLDDASLGVWELKFRERTTVQWRLFFRRIDGCLFSISVVLPGTIEENDSLLKKIANSVQVLVPSSPARDASMSDSEEMPVHETNERNAEHLGRIPEKLNFLLPFLELLATVPNEELDENIDIEMLESSIAQRLAGLGKEPAARLIRETNDTLSSFIGMLETEGETEETARLHFLHGFMQTLILVPGVLEKMLDKTN